MESRKPSVLILVSTLTSWCQSLALDVPLDVPRPPVPAVEGVGLTCLLRPEVVQWMLTKDHRSERHSLLSQ